MIKIIYFSQNRLKQPTEEEILLIEPNFRHVKSLSLRNCDLESWKDVLNVAKLWPYIESLDLQSNGINQITPIDDNAFKTLK